LGHCLITAIFVSSPASAAESDLFSVELFLYLAPLKKGYFTTETRRTRRKSWQFTEKRPPNLHLFLPPRPLRLRGEVFFRRLIFGSPEKRSESTAAAEKTAKMMGFQPIFLGEILVFSFAAL